MRPRKASGWRRWLLGVAAGGILSATTGFTVFSAVASAGLLPTPCVPNVNCPAPSQGPGSLLSPLPSLCLLCTPAPPPPPPCVPHVNCPTPTPGCTSNCGGHGGGSTPTPTPIATVTAGGSGSNSPGGNGGGAAAGPQTAATPSAITVQPPSVVETLSPVAGISFGKAPFLWPLFIALDFLGLGGVVLVLRKTWSKPVAD